MSLNEVLSRVRHLLAIQLFDIAGAPVTLATALSVAVVVAATFYVSHLLQRSLDRVLRRREILDDKNLGVGKRLLHYVVLFVGFGIALETIGIDLKALFAAGAFFAVAIGFAMQNITQNFVSGVILLVERIIKPGDVIEFDNTVAKVQTMGIRVTVVRTPNEEEIIVPNAMLVQNPIKNYTLQDASFRVRASVGVTYDSDMKKVWQVLQVTAADLPWRIKDREPVVLLREFADSSVNFEVSVWIDDPWRQQRHRSQLLDAMWWALKDAGIVIAYPQLDVHFGPSLRESLRGFASTEVPKA
jgi:small-conductance mechanosensitive channel